MGAESQRPQPAASIPFSPAGVPANSGLFIILKVCVCQSVPLAVVALNQLPGSFEGCRLQSQTVYKRRWLIPQLHNGHIMVPVADSLPKVQASEWLTQIISELIFSALTVCCCLYPLLVARGHTSDYTGLLFFVT